VTQVHEATLAFVPKLIAAVLVFAVAGRGCCPRWWISFVAP
jgi:flagellar biosynthesis protein FliQ